MKLQDIYRYFEEPKVSFLNNEMAVCYIVYVLVEFGDSFGLALRQHLEDEYAGYKLSDTVLVNALKFLEQKGVIESYWLNTEGRGRPRCMYQVKPRKRNLARQLAELWQKHHDKQIRTMIPERRLG